ncbi:MAG: LysR family transcriptional regulator [Burkholderiales bacterium]|nr:LysR family transcriptional regulator [Burkholderiales bacterium]
MFDWNDLKYFLALARHGSTLAAGRALQVDASTVQRRLAELERRIGQSLAKRHANGYRLTEFGQAMLGPAQQVEQAVLAFEQGLAAAQRAVAGVVRVTCPGPLVYRLQQSDLLARFQARHPGLQVEFVVSDSYVDLAQGDADIALRSGDTDDGELIGRKIGDSLWAVYGHRDHLARHGTPQRIEDLADHALISFDDSMAEHRVVRWLARVAPRARIVARNNSVLGLLYSAKAGVGLAPLPTALGDSEPELVRVLGPIDELARAWRVLAHPLQRHTPRVAALFDFLVDEVEALRPILTG